MSSKSEQINIILQDIKKHLKAFETDNIYYDAQHMIDVYHAIKQKLGENSKEALIVKLTILEEIINS